MTWLADVTRFPIPGRPGGAFDPGTRWKVCLHTTEGTSIKGAIAAYRKYPPHLIADRATREVVQHISLDKRSYALASSEAEDEPVIQIELVGAAKDTANWSDDDIDWLGQLLAAIRVHCPFDYAYPKQGFGGPEGYGLNGKYRMTMAEWVAFTGVVGHSHSPPPDKHWDPGNFRIGALIAAVQRHAPTPPEQEPDMPATTETIPPTEIDRIIDVIYQRHLGRDADRKGKDWWAYDMLIKGKTRYDVDAAVLASPEAQERLAQLA